MVPDFIMEARFMTAKDRGNIGRKSEKHFVQRSWAGKVVGAFSGWRSKENAQPTFTLMLDYVGKRPNQVLKSRKIIKKI